MKNCLVVHLAFKNPIFPQSTSKIQVMGTKPDPSLSYYWTPFSEAIKCFLSYILGNYHIILVFGVRVWCGKMLGYVPYLATQQTCVLKWSYMYICTTFTVQLNFLLVKSKYINEIKRMENNFFKCHDILMMNVYILLFIFLCKQ